MSALDEKPPLPNSIETVDELRAFLWRQHEVAIGVDDPILVVHTMLRVTLNQIEQQNAKDRREMEKAVKAAADTFTTDVSIAIKNFKEEAIGDVVRERVQAMNEAARQADRASANIRKSMFYQGILTAVNLLAVFFSIGLLFSVAR